MDTIRAVLNGKGSWNSLSFAGMLLVLASVATGCAAKSTNPTTSSEATAAQESEAPKSEADRLQELAQRTDDFTDASRDVGLANDDDHRVRMAVIFDSLERVIMVLEPGEATGGTRQRVRILQGMAQRLRADSREVQVDPSVDQGLRAGYAALQDIARRRMSDDKELADQITELGRRIDHLDAVRGPLHRQSAAQTVEAMARVLNTMNSRIQGLSSTGMDFNAELFRC